MTLATDDVRVTPPASSTPTRRRRAVLTVALLFLFLFVNYADKVVVALAGVDIIKDLDLTKEQFGVVQSSFFWLFAIGSVLGGVLLGRIRARWLLGAMALLWAVSLAPMIGAVGFTTLIACRVLLGFAEGPATAVATSVAHSWFPPEKRALPTSLIVAGAGIGPVISPVLTHLMETYDWHAGFTALFAVGIAWSALWVMLGGSGPEAVGHETASAAGLPERVPLHRLFGTGTLLGLCALFFTSYSAIALSVSWLPLYLREGLGFEAEEASSVVALMFLCSAVMQILVGAVSAYLTRRGVGSRSARCLLAAGLAALGGLAEIAYASMHGGSLQITLIIVSGTVVGAGYGVCYAAVSDVVPARQRSTVMGLLVAVYSLGGVIAPIFLGGLVDAARTPVDGYAHGFTVVGVAVVLGALVLAALANPGRDARKLAASAAAPADVPVATVG